MTARRRERRRNRARRARRREEHERAVAATTEAMRVAREGRDAYAPGMWRALAMQYIFKQHAIQHHMDMAALLPVRQRADDP